MAPSGSGQRNKLFGSVGGGTQAQFMQHGGSGANLPTNYMQNRMRGKPVLPNQFPMQSKPSQQLDMMANDENINQV